MKSLYFVAGEASGDIHGAALMQALRQAQPSIEFHGRGGPRMKSIAQDHFVDWSESSAVIGLWDVLRHYPYFRRQFYGAMNEIREIRPDAVVLIDYPGFNLRLARSLDEHRTRWLSDAKIIYYISPQVWAWNRGRIPKMARYLDLMLCIFPFEAELYNKSGLRTVFVGHPMLESLHGRRAAIPRDPNLIGLFPGSRRREMRKILPVMLETARRIAARIPGTCFEIAANSQRLEEEARHMLATSGLPATMVRITRGEAGLAMQRAQVGIVASGTATLEAAYFRLPFVLVYRLAWLSYLPARAVIKVKHLGMPNVLAGREVIPEFIQHRARPQAIADAVMPLMHEGAERERMLAELDAVISSLGQKEASVTAAQALLEEVGCT